MFHLFSKRLLQVRKRGCLILKIQPMVVDHEYAGLSGQLRVRAWMGDAVNGFETLGLKLGLDPNIHTHSQHPVTM